MKQLDPDEMPSWLAGLLQPASGRLVAGIDEDDCAVLTWGSELLVVTTDYLNARPIALELGIGTLADLGRLNVLANLSDLCGTGAKPEAFMSAVTMPRSSKQGDFELFIEGVLSELGNWRIPLIGGDTKLGASMALLGIALGSAKTTANLFLKRGASPGELVWISGPVGDCNSSVVALSETYRIESLEGWAKDSILRPHLPLDQSRQISHLELGCGGIDISDGLGNDLHRLAKASKVGLAIYADKIPISPYTREVAGKLGVEPWSLAFATGGDMQFIVTSKHESMKALESLGMTCIGETLSQHATTTLSAGNVVRDLPTSGHRDARRTTFTDEILELVHSVSRSFDCGNKA